jgi:hypothetical protein
LSYTRLFFGCPQALKLIFQFCLADLIGLSFTLYLTFLCVCSILLSRTRYPQPKRTAKVEEKARKKKVESKKLKVFD